MRDYSKEINELNYLKRYLILEDCIEAKYSPDSVSDIPKTEHNIEALDSKLNRQAETIYKNCYNVCKFRRNLDAFLGTVYVIIGSSVVANISNYDSSSIKMLTFLFLLGLGNHLLRFYMYNSQMNEIEDMIYIKEHGAIKNPNGEDISLNNVEFFKHKEIKKLRNS